ncbi:MAG: hypothetical protein LIO93_06065, partial [Bacteroidales bacterium]|nr:hypothetical protein [Bacteroidales bacterium]
KYVFIKCPFLSLRKIIIVYKLLTNTMKIALFTMAIGEDCIYFDSVNHYFPYNKKYFGQDFPIDYFLFTDRAI